MALDFESLKNPEWIKKREEQWKLFEGFYGDDFTKKDKKHYREYFFTGSLNKYQVPTIPLLAILFFPIQTLEGHQYALSKFSTIEWDQALLSSLLNSLFLNCPVSSLSAEENANFFKLYAGEIYNPDRKFPFILENESEHRVFPLDPEWLLSYFLRNLSNYLDHKYGPTPISYLLDYMFSLFKAINSNLLTSVKNIDENKILSCYNSGSHYITISKNIRDLLCYARLKHLNRRKHVNCQDLLLEKLTILSDIEVRFNEMKSPSYPEELIDQWQYIKSRNILIEISFSVDDEVKKNWRDFLYCWFSLSRMEHDPVTIERANVQSNYNEIADTFIKRSITDGDLFFNSWSLDWDSDVKYLFATFSSKTIEIANELESFFKTLPVDNLIFEVTKIR